MNVKRQLSGGKTVTVALQAYSPAVRSSLNDRMKVRARAEAPAPVYRRAIVPRWLSFSLCSRRRTSASRNHRRTPTRRRNEGTEKRRVRVRPRAEPGAWTYSSYEGTTASVEARRSTHSVRLVSIGSPTPKEA
jgi:hypothetical protein